MDTIIEFLRDRLDEDEAVARGWGDAVSEDQHRRALILGHHADDYWTVDRILAECKAKRTIMGLHPEILAVCQECDESYPCRTLLALASAYVAHEDYDPAWKTS